MERGTALITGASRGIGRAITSELLSQGWRIVATCRAPEKLTSAEKLEGAVYLPYDASDPGSIEELAQRAGEVDVLIHNAGAGPIGPAEEAMPEKVRDHFQFNLFSAIQLTQAVLPGMRDRRRGAVIFIGSMRSEIPLPFSSLYSASKSAVRSFAECLRMEVMEYGIHVCVVMPIYIRTGLGQEILVMPGSPYAAAMRRVKARRDRDISAASPPEAVAKTIVKILRSRRPKAVYFSGRSARLKGFLARHLPRGLVEAIRTRASGLRD